MLARIKARSPGSSRSSNRFNCSAFAKSSLFLPLSLSLLAFSLSLYFSFLNSLSISISLKPLACLDTSEGGKIDLELIKEAAIKIERLAHTPSTRIRRLIGLCEVLLFFLSSSSVLSNLLHLPRHWKDVRLHSCNLQRAFKGATTCPICDEPRLPPLVSRARSLARSPLL